MAFKEAIFLLTIFIATANANIIDFENKAKTNMLQFSNNPFMFNQFTNGFQSQMFSQSPFSRLNTYSNNPYDKFVYMHQQQHQQQYQPYGSSYNQYISPYSPPFQAPAQYPSTVQYQPQIPLPIQPQPQLQPQPQTQEIQQPQSPQPEIQTQQAPSYQYQQPKPTVPSYDTYNNECGIIRPSLGNYVANGISTRHESWPWHVQLNIAGNNKSDSETYCGATLISRRFILTAAHCYDDLLPHKQARHTLIIMKGIDVIVPKIPGKKYDNTVKFRAKAVYLHPGYIPAMTESEAKAKGVQPGPLNDIAIIEIKHDPSSDIINRLMPICLPDQDHQLNVGIQCKIMGHGFMNSHDEDNFVMPSILQMADVQVSSNQACRDDVESMSIKSKINSDTICVRGPIHPCVGDSGGPLLCVGKSSSYIDGQLTNYDFEDYVDEEYAPRSKWYLNGVTSFAVSTDEHDKCGQFKSAVFTKVSHYINWAYSVMNR